jgi:hypothetical protein
MLKNRRRGHLRTSSEIDLRVQPIRVVRVLGREVAQVDVDVCVERDARSWIARAFATSAESVAC